MMRTIYGRNSLERNFLPQQLITQLFSISNFYRASNKDRKVSICQSLIIKQKAFLQNKFVSLDGVFK